MIIKRKIISFLTIQLNYSLSFFRILFIKFFVQNVIFEQKIKIGKNVKIKTTDGGEIIIKRNVSIEDNVQIYAQNSKILVDENTFIGYGTQIIAKDSITIGKDCLIASYCVIRDSNHGILKEFKINNQNDVTKSINIEDDVWIGTHVVVTKGADIKKGTVVGANSVVTKKFPCYSVIAGVPAKFIKERI